MKCPICKKEVELDDPVHALLQRPLPDYRSGQLGFGEIRDLDAGRIQTEDDWTRRRLKPDSRAFIATWFWLRLCSGGAGHGGIARGACWRSPGSCITMRAFRALCIRPLLALLLLAPGDLGGRRDSARNEQARRPAVRRGR